MMILYIILVFLFVFPIFYKRKMRKYGNKIPGPLALPYIGNAHLVMGDSADFFKTINRFWKEYGTRFRAFIGSQLFLLLSDPKDVEIILSSNQLINKSTDYDFMKPWLGTGLLTAAGEKWRKHRKVITPTFHFKILEHFIQVFDTQSDVLINKLKIHTDGQSFDLFPHITLCALDIISEASMGVSINAQNHSDSEYVTAVKDMCRIIITRMKNPFKRTDFLFMFSSDYWLQKKSLKILHDFTYKMITDRRRLLENSQESFTSYTSESEDALLGKKKKLAFLDMLLLSTVDGKPLDDVSIREEVDTFLFEGHDTTTSGITFALYLIANNPEVQMKLYQEQKDIYGDDLNRPTTHKDLQDMKYLELAIKEALRMFPPVPMIARKVYEDININDMFLPKGCTVILLVYNMNRNPEVFPDPDKFIPERFLPDETSKRSPFSTVSFSAGPRNCIGQKFAMLEMKSSISKVLRNYELLPSPEKFTLSSDIILKTTDGVKIKIKERFLLFGYNKTRNMLVAIICVSTILFLFYVQNKKMYTKDFIGPTPLPFIGNGHQLGLSTSVDFFKKMSEFWNEYGTRFRIFIASQQMIILSEPKDVEVILGSNQLIDKSFEYKYFKPWLGTGLLTSGGDKWRKHRKVITPTFHFKILEHFLQVFDSQTETLIKKLEKHTDGKSFDLFPHITLCALDIISEAAMGVNINAQNHSDSEYVTAVKNICTVIIGRMTNSFKRSDFLFSLSSDYQLQKKSLKTLHDFTYKMISKRREQLENSKENFDSYTNVDLADSALGTKKTLAFLDMLLLSNVDGKPLDDLSIREEVDTFLFEGHDTTTAGISFALYLIAHNPEVQKKLYEEQKDIYGEDTKISRDLQDMKYMELAIKEALRLYPPVAMIGRKINNDTKINDLVLPADSTVLVLIYHMNRNPAVFSEPDKFIPERFLPSETSKRSPFATVSFSAGPRNCIGQKFAILEMKSTISKVIRHYELLPSHENIILSFDIILKSNNGVKIKLAPRARNVCLNLPGPPPLPFIGNAHQCVGSSADFFNALNACWNDFGVRCKVFIGPQLIILLSDPNDVEVVLSNQEFLEKSTEYDFLKPWLGTGLLTSTGEKWKKHRKIITPAFHFTILEHFLQVFDSQTNILINKLKYLCTNGEYLNVYPILAMYALDIISEAAMGVSINAQKNNNSDYVQSVKIVSEIILKRMKSPFKRLDFLFSLTEDYRQQKKALAVLHNFTNKMIQERRNLLQKNNETLDSYTNDASISVYGRKKKMAFLDILLLSTVDGKQLNDTDIREEVDTFLFEGHDTTTSALTFALYSIASNPHVQHKLYEEQHMIFGNDNEKSPSYSDLQDMKYLELTIKEVLRMYPSVPMLGRLTVNDTKINDIDVPAGTTIAILVYNMNRNPAIFPEPDKFIPERFAAEESAKRNPFSMVSFSAGPRNCIGQKFAMLEMKSTLSKIIRTFEIAPSNDPIEIQSDLTLKPVNGVFIKFKSRQ
ncbi:uncharacterized protein LOC143912344 [Arctopsyche grandis]|uniref:uncharacterized protein LOC143912344 n=1 Tax=Arctopsyche grandis TaxID=121162 RepID=UPI00406D9634